MSATIENVLADCLEAIEQEQMTPQECLEQYERYRDELKSLLETVQVMQHVPAIRLNQFYRKTSRTHLMNRIQSHQEQNPRENQVPVAVGEKGYFWLNLQPAFQEIFALLLVVFLLAAGTVRASAGALPGDPLYNIKTSMERAQLVFADEETAIDIHLLIAKNRIGEMEALIAGSRFDDLVITEKSYNYHVAAAKAHVSEFAQYGDPDKDALATTLDNALSIQSQRLHQLLQSVPEPAKAGIKRAIEASRHNPGEVPSSPSQEKLINTPNNQEDYIKTHVSTETQEEKSIETKPAETLNEKNPKEGNKPGGPKRSGAGKGNIKGQSSKKGNPPQKDS